MANAGDNADRDARLRFVEVSDDVRDTLRQFWSVLAPKLGGVLDGFYRHLATEPSLAKLIGSNTDRLKQAQRSHWERLFSGTFDPAYMESIHRIGLAHKRIGLEPRWYIGGYKYVLNQLVAIAIKRYHWTPWRLRRIVSAINTAVLLDMDLAIGAYLDAVEQDVIVNCIGTGLGAMAKGDLTYRISEELIGPFAKLKEDFNGASAHLEETLSAVLTSTSGISNGVREISNAADDLSRRTEQQAASLEETAAALEEITTTLKRTAQNAIEASKLVAGAKSAA